MIGILAGSSLSEAKMRLNKTAVTLTVGESVQLELKGAKKNVTWKNSATVDTAEVCYTEQDLSSDDMAFMASGVPFSS